MTKIAVFYVLKCGNKVANFNHIVTRHGVRDE
jgi:hypothetical protein